jgi:putative ABC transport system permease protein
VTPAPRLRLRPRALNLRESVGIALGALRANKLRSFLTLLGTIIGVMSVIAVVSFVEGMNRYVSEKLLAAGSNVFTIDKYGVITSQEAYEEALRRPDVTPEDGDALRAGMRHAELVVSSSGTRSVVRFKDKTLSGVIVRGRGAGYEVIDDLAIAEGRHLGEFDDQRRRMVAVIGPEVADELFPGRDPIGRTIRIGSYAFEVVGMTQAKGKVLGQSQDRFIAIPIRTFVKYMVERPSVDISIKSADQASFELAQAEARTLMRGRHRLRPGQPDDFAVTTSDTIMDLYRNLTGGIFVVAIGVASISLVVGGIVIMNIMLVSVTERTREIGVRKALGARRRDILAQFLVESTTLSLAGGVVGIGLGVGLALLVGAISPLPAAVSVPALVMGIVMSTLVGVFFGSYPAARAARLDPIEALRYE